MTSVSDLVIGFIFKKHQFDGNGKLAEGFLFPPKKWEILFPFTKIFLTIFQNFRGVTSTERIHLLAFFWGCS
jgi:hypothetical protein